VDCGIESFLDSFKLALKSDLVPGHVRETDT
jgi:hypothetical protein